MLDLAGCILLISTTVMSKKVTLIQSIFMIGDIFRKMFYLLVLDVSAEDSERAKHSAWAACIKDENRTGLNLE